jgi:hypothetical protein
MQLSIKEKIDPRVVIVNFLVEDIEVFGQMLKNRKISSKSYKLINSMLHIKKKLFNFLTPIKQSNTKYFLKSNLKNEYLFKRKQLKDFRDEDVLNKLIFSTEQAQYRYIKEVSSKNNLSENFKAQMESILSAYERIIDQLENYKYKVRISKLK